MNKNYLIIGVAVVALVVSFMALSSGGVPENRVVEIAQQVVSSMKSSLGAIVGPEETNDYHCYGKYCIKYARADSFQKATSTVCALRANNYNTASTISELRFRTTVSTSTATSLVIATS